MLGFVQLNSRYLKFAFGTILHVGNHLINVNYHFDNIRERGIHSNDTMEHYKEIMIRLAAFLVTQDFLRLCLE